MPSCSPEVGINRSEDLATDLVADLFQRDESGHFNRIRSLFQIECASETLTDDQFESFAKKRVIQIAKDSLFRLFKEADPSLARIIRNVKSRLKAHPQLELIALGGTRYVAPRGIDSSTGTLMTATELASQLYSPGSNACALSECLERLVDVFMECDDRYAARVSVSTFALAVRRLNVELAESTSADSDCVDKDLHTHDLLELVDKAVAKAIRPLEKFYVEKGRLEQATFTSVEQGVRIRVKSLIHDEGCDVRSNYDAMRFVSPTMTRQQFRSEYRNVFEYFPRLTRQQLMEVALATN